MDDYHLNIILQAFQAWQAEQQREESLEDGDKEKGEPAAKPAPRDGTAECV